MNVGLNVRISKYVLRINKWKEINHERSPHESECIERTLNCIRAVFHVYDFGCSDQVVSHVMILVVTIVQHFDFIKVVYDLCNFVCIVVDYLHDLGHNLSLIKRMVVFDGIKMLSNQFC